MYIMSKFFYSQDALNKFLIINTIKLSKPFLWKIGIPHYLKFNDYWPFFIKEDVLNLKYTCMFHIMTSHEGFIKEIKNNTDSQLAFFAYTMYSRCY